MDIIFRMLRDVVIDDVAHAGDIDAARGDIGRHHDLVFAALESFERLDPLALRPVRMHDRHGMFPGFQLHRDLVRAVFRPAENQGAVEICPF